jgi:hypothetical protein
MLIISGGEMKKNIILILALIFTCSCGTGSTTASGTHKSYIISQSAESDNPVSDEEE